MGYRTDQFYGIEAAGEAGYLDRWRTASSPPGSEYSSGADNPDFAYPSRVVRTDDHSGRKTTLLRRGYMRSLRTQADGIEVDVKKCGFQFNPPELEQSVVQAEGLLNVFQSDPAQYAQPIPGNVSFGFSLLFDRTMEVNNPSNVSRGTFDPTNPWELSDPSEVGVLRDLAAMYAVIGQGTSSSQESYLTALLTRQLELENDRAETPNDDATATGISAIPEFLNMNTGNVGFLLPVPVRIVFSSLYIVEGFVASTSVKFTKFSTQMVPLQCVVAVNVDAKYIGFAKKDTFLSYSLEAEYKGREIALAEKLKASQDLSTSAAKSVPAVEVSGSFVANAIDQPVLLYDRLFGGVGTVDTSWMYARASQGADTSSIQARYDSGEVVGAKIGGQIQVFGPFNSDVMGDTTQNGLASYLSRGNSTASPIVRYNMATGTSGQNLTAPSTDAWRKMTTKARSGDHYVQGFITPDVRATAYYIVRYSASVEVSSTTNDRIVGTGFLYEVVPPNSDSYTLLKEVPLTWPTYGQNSSGAVVVVDNVAVRPPRVGGTSPIGSQSVRPI